MDVVELLLLTAVGLNICRNFSAIFALLFFEVVSVSQVQEDSIS